METLYPVILLAIAALTMWGVLCEHFDDNLMQRVGMSIICVAAVLQLYNGLVETGEMLYTRSRWLMAVGVLAYAIGTALHAYRRHQRIRNRVAQQ